MVKVKITPFGGYIVGDGDCPFDPDKFMKEIMGTVIAAQRDGLRELCFNDEQVNAIIEGRIEAVNQAIDEAEVKEYKGTRGLKKRVLSMVEQHATHKTVRAFPVGGGDE